MKKAVASLKISAVRFNPVVTPTVYNRMLQKNYTTALLYKRE